jgi:hypothetical protein
MFDYELVSQKRYRTTLLFEPRTGPAAKVEFERVDEAAERDERRARYEQQRHQHLCSLRFVVCRSLDNEQQQQKQQQ